MSTVLACIYGLGIFLFSVAFLIDWIRSRQAIWKYLKYGLAAGVLVVGLDLAIVGITPSAWKSTLWMSLLLEPIVFLRQAGFAMLGMYYAARLGLPSFPLLLRRFGTPSKEKDIPPAPAVVVPRIWPEESPQALQPLEAQAHFLLEPAQVPDNNVDQPAADVVPDIHWKKYFFAAGVVGLAGIVYSVVLFLATSPHLSQLLQQTLGPTSAGTGNVVTIQTILLGLEFAVAEEIAFRLGIQNFLARYLHLEGKGYWLAILLTSVLWTLGHAGTLDPEWVKFAQIFPMGLALGWLFKKYGTESTILAHGLFNVILLFLSPYLVR